MCKKILTISLSSFIHDLIWSSVFSFTSKIHVSKIFLKYFIFQRIHYFELVVPVISLNFNGNLTLNWKHASENKATFLQSVYEQKKKVFGFS